jgi:hypothetical protein
MPKPFDVAGQLAQLAERETTPRPRREPAADGWPSREPEVQASTEEPQGQITMRGRARVIERFRAICKDDRRTYLDMLEILMDRYEGR